MREEPPRLGRDEMNIAEYPISLLTERVPKGVRVLEFQDAHGKLTIRGSEGLGLPTAVDTDLIIGLLQLTKAHSNFTEETVPFVPHGLMTLMGWPNQGHYYRRLRDSLNRWVGTTLFYQGTWWDNSSKGRIDASLHIIDNVMIFDGKTRRTSSFTWGKLFFESCKNGNLRGLDIGVYFGLNSAVTKQLYRFLGKHFYRQTDHVFNLRELAFAHVGLSRNYTDAKIKEKLKPALGELETIGFLKPMTTKDRYLGGRGDWQIRLVRADGVGGVSRGGTGKAPRTAVDAT